MQLLYDARDTAYHEKVGSRIPSWLHELSAVSLDVADPTCDGFLYAGARPLDDYRRLVACRPLVRDRPEEREPLLCLDSALRVLEKKGARVPTPKTWVLPLDAPLPDDLTFPLFVRTAQSSWKKGGHISRVKRPKELEEEAAELRRALGWDATVLARQWLDLAPAGEGRYGPVPQEVRTWVVDGVPFAWSFHHLHIIPRPAGFPPSAEELATLREWAGRVGAAFRSRLVVADFARGRDGRWWLIEVGPGSCAGTAHEAVFKATAVRLKSGRAELLPDTVGGPL
jgi:hypothetical protein